MINPLAGTFMIATRMRQSPYWEDQHFANLRDNRVRPRLLSAPPRHRSRSRFRLFRRRPAATDPRDL
ncbi:hypothetical protein [Pseudoruegeria sp. HB172150]|uniref:hypothetical protein n=1 Tax=Pseudoruegeria sp. HB172150 TaxID=2721164 RepID=UPI001C131039|nr:hypothetical protein [Pseudoruegeria sp. HB172150]